MEILFSTSAAGGLKCSHAASGPVCAFDLVLSVGDISEDIPGPRRREALRALERSILSLPGAEDHIDQCVTAAAASLETLLRLSVEGEPVRIYYSHQPDELCGLCWLLSRLDPPKDRSVSLVRLPLFEQREDGCLVSYTGWGEVHPRDWPRFLSQAQPVSPVLVRAAANRWKELQRENAPLRAVVNGRLSSVPEDFYDPFLRQELARTPEEFSEAAFIGNVLGRFQLGIGDGLVASRVEAMLRAGELEALTEAPEGAPTYRRTLRKRI